MKGSRLLMDRERRSDRVAEGHTGNNVRAGRTGSLRQPSADWMKIV